MSYILQTPFGPFCSVCQSPVGPEEEDWDECDVCGGEGITCEEVEDYDTSPSPSLSGGGR